MRPFGVSRISPRSNEDDLVFALVQMNRDFRTRRLSSRLSRLRRKAAGRAVTLIPAGTLSDGILETASGHHTVNSTIVVRVVRLLAVCILAGLAGACGTDMPSRDESLSLETFAFPARDRFESSIPATA